MRVIVGLGNPGAEYAESRHNVGQWVIRRASRDWAVPLGSAQWGQIGSGRLGQHPVTLVVPATWMNLTGEMVEPLLQFLDLNPSHLIVVHDDMDLSVGRLRIKLGGGSGGHNGLRSIDASLGDNMYGRVKIGIGRPEPEQEAADFVLSPFLPEDLVVIDEVMARAVKALYCMVTEGVEGAMNQYNRKMEED